MLRIKCAFIVLLSIAVTAFSQTDNKFWFVAPDITSGHDPNPPYLGGEPIYLVLTSTGTPVEVRIHQPANPSFDTIFVDIPAGESEKVELTSQIDDIENFPDDVTNNKGLLIESKGGDITAYYEVGTLLNPEIFVLKGKNALGYEFVVPGQNIWENNTWWYSPSPFQSINIVATEDNTVIEITPSQDAEGSHPADSTFEITLNKGQTYCLRAAGTAGSEHLPGTKIVVVSGGKIAVTLGDDSVQRNTCPDLNGDQLIPVNLIGKEYLVIRGESNFPNELPEMVFITAVEDLTEIYIDGTYKTTINALETYSDTLFKNATYIEASKDIYVYHMAGFNCEMGGAVLPTIEGCSGSHRVSFSRSLPRPFYMNLMVRDGGQSGFTLHYEDSTTWQLPDTLFEQDPVSGWWTLKDAHELFADSKDGGVPTREATTITNDTMFHVGIINGEHNKGCSYGYFSDYSVNTGSAEIISKTYDENSYYQYLCPGENATLKATGGYAYEWAPHDYLDDPFSATPVVSAPPGIHTYSVHIHRECYPDTTIKVTIEVLPEVNSHFTVDLTYGCTSSEALFMNDSSGATDFRWDFDGDGMVDFTDTVYHDSIYYTYTNTSTEDSIFYPRLVTSYNGFCPKEYTDTIAIPPRLNARFTVSDTIIESRQQVTFINNSTVSYEECHLSLGDNHTSTVCDTVTHTYYNQTFSDTTYTAQWIFFKQQCADTAIKEITVKGEFSHVTQPITHSPTQQFWFVAPDITSGHDPNPPYLGGEPIYLVLTSTGNPVEVRIHQPANPAFDTIIVNIPAGGTVKQDLTSKVTHVENFPFNSINNKGIYIESKGGDITAYYEVGTVNNTDLFALKGDNALGTEFVVPTQTIWENNTWWYNPDPYHSIHIVATQDNTVIKITPAQDSEGHPAGTPFNIVLDKGQTYCLKASGTLGHEHLSGTKIEVISGGKIAVTLSDDSIHRASCADQNGDQMIPVDLIGKEYLVMKGEVGTPGGLAELIFITAIEDSTNIYMNGEFRTSINAFETFADTLITNTSYIETTKDVYVYHMTGFSCQMGGAVLPTIEGCTGSNTVSFARSLPRPFYMNLMVKDGGQNGFTLHYEDGSAWHMSDTLFEQEPLSGWWSLKDNNELFANNRAGGVPADEVTTITNDMLFHIGIINGEHNHGCNYGYFSDFSENTGSAMAAETGTQKISRCNNDTIQLMASGGYAYEWTPHDYLDDPYSAFPKATPPESGQTYSVNISRGCRGDTSIQIVILPTAQAHIVIEDSAGCSPVKTALYNHSMGANLFKWDFDGDGLYDSVNYNSIPGNTVDTLIYTYSNDSIGLMQVRPILTASYNDKCTSHDTADITIYHHVKADFTVSDTILDSTGSITITNLSKGGSTFIHDFGDGDTAYTSTFQFQHMYSNQSTLDTSYVYQLVVYSPHCKDSNSQEIIVKGKPMDIKTVKQNSLCIYPTIIEDDDILHVNNPSGEPLEYVIYTIQGVKMNSGFIKDKYAQISTKTLIPGSYLIGFSNQEGDVWIATKQVIIQ
jgi:hypothetical protein